MCIIRTTVILLTLIGAAQISVGADQQTAPAQKSDVNRLVSRQAGPVMENNVERPLRYRPDGTDFVIENGTEFFNRPLYGANTPFRIDAGYKPEFALYLPGRGGNLRLGIRIG